ALRQPGSAFKPIVYARAIEDKTITAATVLKDRPRTFAANYRPQNYDRKFRGDVLVRRALANSLNVPAVEVMEKVGTNNVLTMAGNMGITTLKSVSDYGPSLVLGTGETRLTELTSAYGVFANGGKRIPITTITKVQNKQGKTIFRNRQKSTQVINPAVAFIVSSILSDNAARAELFSNRLNVNRPAAVKTGTTEDYRDALTVGYTPSVVVGVWVGNNDNTPMDNIAGSLGPAPVWRSLIERYSKGLSSESFKPPGNVAALSVCRSNGLKALRPGAATYTEYFLERTEPTQSCNVPAPAPKPKNDKNDVIKPKEEERPGEEPLDDTPVEPTPSPTPEPTPTPLPPPQPPVTP
ncbi:MAG TPA: penicillin-binding transpeptidase domain-containing protein, partial [Candidatus Saccharimonadia bacterium]